VSRSIISLYEFRAKVLKIGVNPYVLLPQKVLKAIFVQAAKDKGPIPVKGKLDGHGFQQTLVKYSGKWRLYLNTPMRKAAGKDVGDEVKVHLEADLKERIIAIHPELEAALHKNKRAKSIFDALPPSRKKEIIRYINHLKTDESRKRNIVRAIRFLSGTERFVGRDKP